jgi:hypothetical protein
MRYSLWTCKTYLIGRQFAVPILVVVFSLFGTAALRLSVNRRRTIG